MRIALFLFAVVQLLCCGGCNRAPTFALSDQSPIRFTNGFPAQLAVITLGKEAREEFIATVQQPVSDFEPKMLEASTPMGKFQAGDYSFEYHLGVVVFRSGHNVYIWRNDFSRRLGDALLKKDDTWKDILAK